MKKGEMINAILTLILALVLGISQVYLAIENNKLEERFYQLQEESLRADINVFINPIPNQNWTFTSNYTYITIDGMLVNEGARSTIIKKIEVAIIYNFSDGKEYVDQFSPNPSNFLMQKYIIAPKESRQFNMSIAAYPTMELNRYTGELIGIYYSKPDRIRILVYHDDGEGEQLDYKSIP